ncbi:hypothetical protein L6452_26198 [Arctium lappa]|uniref:Uncharacterized protein n=1 Tax=Arctium lappa TaxID=4217 RepID=A0ACB9ABH5_ARCLA|nr:hypothetical protein L6452_26198 [Arctium lappa]
MASEQHSSEPVITGVLASGQISPEPASQAIKSDEASTSTNHLFDLDLLFELFYDEFLGSNVKKYVVVDRMEDSTTTHPTSSDISIEIPVQMPTLTVEAVTNNEETEVVVSAGCSVQTNLQPDQVVPAEISAPTTSTITIIPPELPEEGSSGFIDDNIDIYSYNPLLHEHKWTKEHPISQIIGDPTKPVQTRTTSMNMCMHESFLSKIELNRVSEALANPEGLTAMQEELNQFEALQKQSKTCSQRIQTRGRNRLWRDLCSRGAFRGNLNVSRLCSPQELHGLSNGREDNISEWNSERRSLCLTARRLCQPRETDSRLHSRQINLWTEISSLRLFKMENSKPIGTPMAPGTKIGSDLSGEVVDVRTNRGMIGSLMYLMSSRPDIMFSTCLCARYQANPKESHLTAFKRIFKYLKGTADIVLWYPKDTRFELTAYTDADHAGCMLDKKSTSGHIQFLGDKLVVWIRTQLRDYGFHFDKIPIYCDSKSAIAITANPVQHTKSKHIDVRYSIHNPRGSMRRNSYMVNSIEEKTTQFLHLPF